MQCITDAFIFFVRLFRIFCFLYESALALLQIFVHAALRTVKNFFTWPDELHRYTNNFMLRLSDEKFEKGFFQFCVKSVVKTSGRIACISQ